MRAFIFLCCVITFASNTGFSQNAEITIDSDTKLSVEEVFDLIKKQTKYAFMYPSDLFNNSPKISVKKGTIKAKDLLIQSLSHGNFTYDFSEDGAILLKKNQTNIKIKIQQTVSGVITDGDGVPLAGANIIEKGTTNGTQTDFDGNYTIDISGSEAVLTFSYIGFITQEITVGNQSTINLTMQEDAARLDEIIVVGYGTQKKSDLTGAVSSVKGEDIQKLATSTAADGLQGNVAGLVVRRGSGSPRSGASINIRGFRSIGGNNPLVIIDGIQGNFNLLNPDDIASVEVLKDGAAAAIYGSLSANGVVLVTTKTGSKDGKLKIDYSSYYGIDRISNTLDFANTSQYLEMAKKIEASSPGSAPSYIDETFATNTNWMDELFDNGAIQNHNLTVSGGTSDLNFLVSAGLNKRDGILKDESRKKQQLRAKINGTKGRVTLGANIYYVQTDDNIFGSNINRAYQLMPIIPVRDSSKNSGFGYISDDDFNGVPDHTNPIGEDAFNDNTRKERNLVTNFSGSIDIIKGLKLTGRAGIENANVSTYERIRPHQVSNKREVEYHSVEEYRSEYLQTNYEGFLNYDNTFEKHTIGLLAGISKQDISLNWIGASVEGKKILDDGSEVSTGFLDSAFNTLDSGADGIRNNYGSGWETARHSIYGRVNYSYDDRYFLQGTIRRDGSSRFGSSNRYGVFPSVAAGWKISNENFFDIDAINFLKLRASWGKLGSESNLEAYDYAVNTVSGYRYPFGTNELQSLGITFRDFPNSSLQWETTVNINVGLDFGLLNSKFTGAINYYQRNTEDMIIPAIPPNSSGFNPIFTNGGDVENTGIELEVNYRNNVGEFKYDLGLVFSHNKNELTKVNKDTDTYTGDATTLDGSPANISKLGYPIGSFWLYETDGLFQTQAEVDAHNVNGDLIQPLAAPGDIKFKDINGDGQLNDDDLVYSGSGIPKTTLGLNLSGSYKGFDAYIQFYGAFGQKGYNTIRQNYEANDNYRNYLVSGLDTWTPTNTDTNTPRAVLGDPNQNSSRNSNRFLENASFLRLRNVQIGYTLPASITDKLSIGKLRLYVSLQNILTITDYSGIDPEIGGTLNAGSDFVSYPNIKTSLFGVQVNF